MRGTTEWREQLVVMQDLWIVMIIQMQEMYEKLYEAITKKIPMLQSVVFKIIYPDRVELFNDEEYYNVLGRTGYLEEYLKLKNIWLSMDKINKEYNCSKIEFPVGEII